MRNRIALSIITATTLAVVCTGPALAGPQSLGDDHDRWGVIHCDGPYDEVTVHALFVGDVHLAVHVPRNGVFIYHPYLHWGHWTSKPFLDGSDLEWHAADHGGESGAAYVDEATYATCDAFAKG